MVLEINSVYIIRGNSGTKLAEVMSSAGKSVLKLKADTHPAKCIKRIATSRIDNCPIVQVIDAAEYKTRGGRGPIVQVSGTDIVKMKNSVKEETTVK